MSYKFFQNKECEFFPCHKAEKINCLFCFCPLYGMDCGGNFELIKGEKGELIKDCSKCTIPHSDGGYDYIMEKLTGKG